MSHRLVQGKGRRTLIPAALRPCACLQKPARAGQDKLDCRSIREQRMIEAAKIAARAADGSTDGVVLLDSLDVMEVGMRYFFGRFQTEKAEKKPDWDKADSALLQAVA